MLRSTLTLVAVVLLLGGCNRMKTSAPSDDSAAAPVPTNPLLVESPLPFGYPQFDLYQSEHFGPAMAVAMAEKRREIAAIATNPAPATFENTVVALETVGPTLTRINRIFSNLKSAHTNDVLDAVDAETAPQFAALSDEIFLNPNLFARVESVLARHAAGELQLDPESTRLLTRTHQDFVRAGARLDETAQARLREINAEIATLQTTFRQNVLGEVNASAVFVESAGELAGLSPAAIAAAAAAAEADGKPGQFKITLTNTSGQPPLASLENRALRERIHHVSLARGSSGGEFDNRQIVLDLTRLRAERAQLLGYAHHAANRLEVNTAQTTEAVNQRLARLAVPAAANARREAVALQAAIEADGHDFELQAWDWDFYTERVRAERFDYDENELRPYLELDRVLTDGVFYAATQLFGITFKPRPDLPVYHPDVRVWEIFDADGSTLAYFLGDFYARPSKRGGAWMNSYVVQSRLLGAQPVIANHQNIPAPAEGEPTLMTWGAVNTMFHEFGHALHGMFSDVQYPQFAGTSVPRDYVEFPSQVNEMWRDWPSVLENFAVHHETGEPIPADLLAKIEAASKFNQGFATSEYLAASIVDQAWHQLGPDELPDTIEEVMPFEAAVLQKAGLAFGPVPPRYRTTYFSHTFAGGYSAAYYSYIWSEVLDADSVEWFKANGGLTRANGDHFRNTLLSRGESIDPMQQVRDFLGRETRIEPLLERRGLN